MESAAEALQMAAAVLIFVLALSISINAFGEVRQTSRTILDYKDREYDYTYITSGTTQRQVGLETIIPSIYKAYKENYKIIFDIQNINDKNGLYSKKNENDNYDEINYIDLEKEVLGSDKQKEEFIKAIIYGKDSISDEYKKEFSDLGINLKDVGIYARIEGKNKKVTEKLGVYYQEDMQTGGSNTPDANKTKKRVITYTDK